MRNFVVFLTIVFLSYSTAKAESRYYDPWERSSKDYSSVAFVAGSLCGLIIWEAVDINKLDKLLKRPLLSKEDVRGLKYHVISRPLVGALCVITGVGMMNDAEDESDGRMKSWMRANSILSFVLGGLCVVDAKMSHKVLSKYKTQEKMDLLSLNSTSARTTEQSTGEEELFKKEQQQKEESAQKRFEMSLGFEGNDNFGYGYSTRAFLLADMSELKLPVTATYRPAEKSEIFVSVPLTLKWTTGQRAKMGAGIGDVNAWLSYQILNEKQAKLNLISQLGVMSNAVWDPGADDLDDLPIGNGFWNIIPAVSISKTPHPRVLLFSDAGYVYRVKRFDIKPGAIIRFDIGSGFVIKANNVIALETNMHWIGESKWKYGLDWKYFLEPGRHIYSPEEVARAKQLFEKSEWVKERSKLVKYLPKESSRDFRLGISWKSASKKTRGALVERLFIGRAWYRSSKENIDYWFLMCSVPMI